MEEFEPIKKIKFKKTFFYKYVYVFVVGLLLLFGTSYSNYFLPVISLKGDIFVTGSGDGTTQNPYIIKTSS